MAARPMQRLGPEPEPRCFLPPWIWPAGPQRFERINHKRKRLEIDLEFFQSLPRSEFVNGSHGENRLALIQWFHWSVRVRSSVGFDYSAVVGQAIGWRRKFIAP